MADRAKGLIVSLTLVTVAALAVSFFSGAKTRDSRKQMVELQGRMRGLSKTRQSLETRLSQAQAQAAQEAMAAQEFKEALLAEQLRSQALAQELGRQQAKSGQDAKIKQATKTAQAAKGPTTNFTTSKGREAAP